LIKFDKMRIRSLYDQRKLQRDYMELLAGVNRLGAYRTIFLTYNARFVHGPGQAAPSIDKSGSYFDGALGCKLISPQALIQANGSNGAGGTQVTASYALLLTTAGTHTEIENGGPQAFQTPNQAGRMDDIGGTNPHTLAAFDAA
jgi:hypothetical protein